MSPDGLAWALASAAFGLAWGLAAYFARRDRAAIHAQIQESMRRLDGLGKAIDGMRKDIQALLLDHERRLTRIETIIGFEHEQRQ